MLGLVRAAAGVFRSAAARANSADYEYVRYIVHMQMQTGATVYCIYMYKTLAKEYSNA